MNVDAGDLASERLARRLQEEEDSYAAFHLQSQLNHHGILGGSSVVSPPPHISQRLGHLSPTVRYIISDEDNDDDPVRVLDFSPVSSDPPDCDMPMSPETHLIVTDALNTAFSSPNTSQSNASYSNASQSNASYSNSSQSNSDDIMIVDEREDQRPNRRTPPTIVADDGNIVLTVGRSLRSSAPSHSSDSSIVITNTPSANTRSRTRSNTTMQQTPTQISTQQTTTQITDSRPRNRLNRERITRASAANTCTSTTRAGATPTRAGATTTRASTALVPTSNTDHHVAVSISSDSSQSSGGPRRSSDVVEIQQISDNQPSTSSGRRANRGPRHGRYHRQRGNVSSRIIINGVPVHRSHFSDHGHFMNQIHAISNFIPLTGGMFWQGDDSMTYEEMIALDDENTLEPGQGLSKSDINQNTMNNNYSKESSKCSSCNICLNEFNDGEKIRTLPCFHSFHTKCIDNWLTRKPECPVCRCQVGSSSS